MKECIFCGAEFLAERPYEHCPADDCVTIWKQRRRADMAIVLLPKQGFGVIYKADAAKTPTTTKK